MPELLDKNGLTEKEYLAGYDPGRYPRPSLTADIVLFAVSPEKKELLLVKRGGHPFLGCWALPGGFAEENESLEATAARELAEETGLRGLARPEPIGLFSRPGRDPRGWVVSQAYLAVAQKAELHVRAGDDAAGAAWFETQLTGGNGGPETLRLTAPQAALTIPLGIREVRTCRGVRRVCFAENGGGLAFDHASILAAAVSMLRGVLF